MELSLDVGSKKIKAVLGRYSGGKVIVERYFEVDTPPGSVVNGRIQKMQPLEEVLRAAVKQHKLGRRKSAVSLRSADTFFKELTLPDAKAEDMRGLVEHAVASSWAGMTDYFVDYTVGGPVEKDGKQMRSVTACCVQKQIVLDYHRLLRSAGLVPERMDVQQNSLRKLLSGGGSVNGNDLRVGVAVLMDVGSSLLGADLFVGGRSIYEQTAVMGASGGDREQVRRRVAEEIRKMSMFSMSLPIREPVGYAYLFGGSGKQPDFCRQLSESLGIQVEPVRSMSRIELANGVDADICDVIGCAGALMKGMEE